jgi:hypothetical protein
MTSAPRKESSTAPGAPLLPQAAKNLACGMAVHVRVHSKTASASGLRACPASCKTAALLCSARFPTIRGSPPPTSRIYSYILSGAQPTKWKSENPGRRTRRGAASRHVCSGHACSVSDDSRGARTARAHHIYMRELRLVPRLPLGPFPKWHSTLCKRNLMRPVRMPKLLHGQPR